MKKSLLNGRCPREKLKILCMRSIILLFTFCVTIASGADGQNVKLSMNLKNASLSKLFQEIEKNTDYSFVYNSSEIDKVGKSNFVFQNMELKQILDTYLKGNNFSYAINDGHVVINRVETPQQQPIKNEKITGKVLDHKGKPLAQVVVAVKGSTNGTVTDNNGSYSINIQRAPDLTLQFTFLGMKHVEMKVGTKTVIDVKMEEAVDQLKELVVTGYQDIRRDRVTGSMTVITAKELEDNSFKSIDQILEGKVAGLYSFATSGAPGTRSNIRIRGDNSISGNKEPLWVVDGLPMQGGVPSINVIDVGNIQQSVLDHGIGNLAPDDIETITVLKDAAATAIYGARAANGVIVIKTKKGFSADSKSYFNYRGSYGVNMAPNIDLDFMSGAEKVDFEIALINDFNRAWEGGYAGKIYSYYMNGAYTQEQYDKEINELKNTNTDWFDEIFRKSSSQSHFFSMRGGTGKTGYYTSINYKNQRGILKSNVYNAIGANFNISHRPNKNIEITFGLNGTFRSSKDHDSNIDPFKYAVFANRYEPAYDQNGGYGNDKSYLADNRSKQHFGRVYDGFSILRELNETQNTSNASDVGVNAGVNVNVVRGLKVDLLGSATYSTNNSKAFANAGTYASYSNSFSKGVFGELPASYNNGYLREGSGTSTSFALRGLVTYTNEDLDNHAFSAVFGSEVSGSDFLNNGHTAPEYDNFYNFISFPQYDGALDYNDVFAKLSGMMSTALGQNRSASFFGAFTYTLLDKYVFNINGRFDGADIIASNNRFTPLWSASFRWNIMRENFLKNVPFLSDLALRLSYGYTGNIDKSAYPISIVTLGGLKYDNEFTAQSVKYPTPNIRWEKKQDRNIGLDFGFLDNKIGGSFNYYNNIGIDLLGTITTAPSYGRQSLMMNTASVQNQGVEFNINFRLNLGKDIRWINSFNIAHNTNKILNTYDKSSLDFSYKGGAYNLIGKPTGATYGYRFAGVNPQTGSSMVYISDASRQILADKRGVDVSEVSNIYSVDDDKSNYQTVLPASLEIIGSANPDIVGGFMTNFVWKSFEVRASFSYCIGQMIEVFNERKNVPSDTNKTSEIYVSKNNRLKSAVDRWRTPGDVTNTPRYQFSAMPYHNLTTDDKFENGNFLAWRDLSFSYGIKSKALTGIGINQLKVGLQVSNLAVFTNYSGLDVTTGGAFNYPLPKSFLFNLSIGF